MNVPPLLFPPLSWFQSVETISLEGNLVKQSLMNRFWIKAPGQPMVLIVPVAHIGRTRKFSETTIVYQDSWPVRMERSIESCYRKAAYFEHYFPEIQKLLQTPYDKLQEMNLASLFLLAKGMGFPSQFNYSSDPFVFPENVFPSRPNAVSEHESPRYQLFGPFVPGLSSLDALFHYGPDTKQYLVRRTL
jgi:hypothetical protein